MAITQRVIVDANQALKSLKGVDNQVKRVETSAKKAGSRMDSFGKIAGGVFAGVIAYRIGARLFSEFAEAARGAVEFQKRLAEIETLMPEAERNTQRLSNSLITLSNRFGQDARSQARGFYDIVSAGVQGFAKQIDVLNTTNKIAIGGVTDTATATNLLVGAMNAFAKDGETAASVADILFTTVRKGITTIPQLASSLGQVNSIASNTGVRLKEVGAAMATLTAGGVQTARAATALKATISAFSKPTAKGQKLIEKLGLSFSVSALQAKGFTQIMTEIREATKGNTEQLITLFPNQRAQEAILPLLGRRWGEFSKTLKEFNSTSGATDQAFERITNTASFQLSRFQTILDNLVVSFQSLLDRDIAKVFKDINAALESDGPTIFATSLVYALQVTNLAVRAVNELRKAYIGFVSALQLVAKTYNVLVGVTTVATRQNTKFLQETLKDFDNFINKSANEINAIDKQSESFAKTIDELSVTVGGLPDKLEALRRSGNAAGGALQNAAAAAGKLSKTPPPATVPKEKIRDNLAYADSISKALGFSKGFETFNRRALQNDKSREKERIKIKQESLSEIGALTKNVFGEYQAFQIGEAVVAFRPPFAARSP